MLDELSRAIDQGRLGGHRQGLVAGLAPAPGQGLAPEQGQGPGQGQGQQGVKSDVSFLSFLIQVITPMVAIIIHAVNCWIDSFILCYSIPPFLHSLMHSSFIDYFITLMRSSATAGRDAVTHRLRPSLLAVEPASIGWPWRWPWFRCGPLHGGCDEGRSAGHRYATTTTTTTITTAGKRHWCCW